MERSILRAINHMPGRRKANKGISLLAKDLSAFWQKANKTKTRSTSRHTGRWQEVRYFWAQTRTMRAAATKKLPPPNQRNLSAANNSRDEIVNKLETQEMNSSSCRFLYVCASQNVTCWPRHTVGPISAEKILPERRLDVLLGKNSCVKEIAYRWKFHDWIQGNMLPPICFMNSGHLFARLDFFGLKKRVLKIYIPTT